MRCSNCEAALVGGDDSSHLRCSDCGAIHANPRTLHARPVDAMLDDLLIVPSDQEIGEGDQRPVGAWSDASDQREGPEFDSVSDALDAALGMPTPEPSREVRDSRAARSAAQAAVRSRARPRPAAAPPPSRSGARIQVRDERSSWFARLALVTVGLVIAVGVAAMVAVAVLT